MRVQVGPLLVAIVLCGMGPVQAQNGETNLLGNPDLAAGIQGWAGHEGTQLQWDETRGKPAPGSIMVSGLGGRQAAVQEVELRRPANALDFSGSCYCERVEGETPMVALDMGVTLDDGQMAWVVPVSARVAKGAAQWQHLTGRYLAPEGRSITSVKFFCLNYRNNAPAWFDDLSLSASQLTMQGAQITILAALTEDGKARETRLRAAAQKLGKPLATSPLVPSLDECSLLIVPEWENSDLLLENVKTFYYRGGRILLGWLPARQTGLAMWYWLFDGVRQGEIAGDSTGLAAAWVPDYQPTAEALAETLQKLMAAELKLPEAPAPLGAWSAPALSLDRKAVYIDGKPTLLFGAGAYSVGADWTEPDRDMAEFADLGMNAVVLYVNSAYPLEELRKVLDAAQQQGLYCLLYLSHGRGTHHPGRPWRAEWIAKFSALAGHPAFLAWLTGDDVFAQHQEMMIRTRELIRHYDKRALICMTLMDLRRPERFDEAHWRRWDKAFDFPVPYVYTLQRGDGFQTAGAMLGGLVDLQRLGDNANEHFPKMPHFQWVQAHMQQDMWKRLGLAVEERWLPTPEQQALLVLHALAGGTDGLLYFTHRTITAEAGGLGRRQQLQVLHHQLKPIGEILLLGEKQHLVVEGEAAATLFDAGEQAVILIRRVHQYDQGQVNIGSPVAVTVKLPEKFAASKFVRLTPLGIEELATTSDATLRFDRFAGWEIVATSSREGDFPAWDSALARNSEDIREALRGMLRDTYLKTRAVMEVLERGGLAAADARDLLAGFSGVEAFLPDAGMAAPELVRTAEARRDLLGRAQETQLASAAAFWAERSDDPLPEAARTFYGLPYFYQQAGVELGYAPGQMGKMIAGQ